MSQLLSRLVTKARSVRRMQRYRRTLRDLGATFVKDSLRPGAELVTVRGLTFSIKSDEDWFILTEVFDRQCYNFHTSAETVVVDIGMNIGVASLSFAADPHVRHVYSFEPFPRTFELACANLARNPSCSAKVTPHNFGLSDRDCTEELPYIEERKGSVGVEGMPLGFTPSRQDVHVQSIQLRDAAVVLYSILDAHADANCVLKMDCEGSEYAIFRSLDDAGLLDRFQTVMLEWHRHGPQELRDALEKHGFAVFTFGDLPSLHGMLYAVNIKSRKPVKERAAAKRKEELPLTVEMATIPFVNAATPSL